MPRESLPVSDAGTAAKTLVILCCIVALAGEGTLLVFVVLLGLDKLPRAIIAIDASPWLIDAAWLVAFALQHSGMARTGFKSRLARSAPPSLERSLYVGLSGVVLAGMCLTWQYPPGEPIWRLPYWVLAIGIVGAAASGLFCLRFDTLQFFGVRRRGQADADSFEIAGPYRFVRHPMMTGLLVFFWAQPVLTPALAFLSGGMTIYILLGTKLEERDMVRRFGPAYEAYRARVPAFLPWRRPLPASIYSPLQKTPGSA